jgi:hypothetical protein
MGDLGAAHAKRVDPGPGVLGVLVEPTTVVAKAWEHIAAIGRRTFSDPQTVVVAGTRREGPWTRTSGLTNTDGERRRPAWTSRR